MTWRDWLQLVIFLLVLLALTPPLGRYLEKVFEGKPHPLKPVLGWLEKLTYKLLKLDPEHAEQSWQAYAVSLLTFCAISVTFSYVILRLQHRLPLNPQGLGPLSPHLSFNTAIGFITGTAWTSYSSESTVSYFSQMVGLVYQNFMAPATGVCAALVLTRGLARREQHTVGNFWVDLIRGNLYVLLPLCIVFAVFLMWQGVVQNFLPYVEATTLEGVKQLIAQGPAASQIAIKMLGSNGEGFFAANAAHPYENPTALSNFVQMLSMFLIPSALVYYFGRAAGHLKHAWSIWITMALLFVGGAVATSYAESSGNPALVAQGCSSPVNLEGKEARFGIFNSALFATITTDTSTGATNSALDSFTPLGSVIPLVNMHLGEVIFGGVGSGLFGILIYVLLAVFIAGLMVGRTPEYLGKKIEGREMKYVTLYVIALAFLILVFAAWGVLDPRGTSSISNPGPHGFSEVLYAYSSGGANNGSSFGGLSTNTPFWNLTLAFVMFLGRFLTIVPVLAIGGSMAKKRVHPESSSTFPVHGGLFIGLLTAVILILGALTFFPALALGPIAEHFDMTQGHFFH